MPDLALRNFRSWKLAKKGDFTNFLDQFQDFTLKSAHKIFDPPISWKPFETIPIFDYEKGPLSWYFLLIKGLIPKK